MALGDDIQRLLAMARDVYSNDPSALHDLEQVAGRLAEPLRVAIVGRVKAGKSTLLNALVGEELAPTDAGECTKIVTWYRQGHTYRVMLKPTGAPDRVIVSPSKIDAEMSPNRLILPRGLPNCRFRPRMAGTAEN